MASRSEESDDRAPSPATSPASVDIKAVLSAAMHRTPPDDLADRVMSRVNFVETVANFATLVGLVPAKAATASIASHRAMHREDESSRQDEDEDERGGSTE